MRKVGEYESPCINWYDDQVPFMPELDSPRRVSYPFASLHHHYHCKQEPELMQYNIMPHDPFLQLPQLESPKVPQSATSVSCNSIVPYGFDRNSTGSALQSSTLTQEEHMQQGHLQNMNSFYCNNEQAVDQATDWRVLDKFVASQLSHDQLDASKETSYSNAAVFHMAEHMNMLASESKRPEIAEDFGSTSASSCQIDLWKWKIYDKIELQDAY